jgi:hypothetical protein
VKEENLKLESEEFRRVKMQSARSAALQALTEIVNGKTDKLTALTRERSVRCIP